MQTQRFSDVRLQLRSAVAAGIDCAIVYNEFTESHDFSQAHYRIRTLAELKDTPRKVHARDPHCTVIGKIAHRTRARSGKRVRSASQG